MSAPEQILVSRRNFLRGLFAAAAAPAIVRVASIMPVKAPPIVVAPAGGYLMPQEYWAVVHPHLADDLKRWLYGDVPPLAGEVGHLRGLRFIESEPLPYESE
jgi:hypothetical protein